MSTEPGSQGQPASGASILGGVLMAAGLVGALAAVAVGIGWAADRLGDFTAEHVVEATLLFLAGVAGAVAFGALAYGGRWLMSGGASPAPEEPLPDQSRRFRDTPAP